MKLFQGIPIASVEKLYDLQVAHKGFQIPVAVYQVEELSGLLLYYCVCFENTVIDRHIQITKNVSGNWYDLMDRDEQLAAAIGGRIDSQVTEQLCA